MDSNRELMAVVFAALGDMRTSLTSVSLLAVQQRGAAARCASPSPDHNKQKNACSRMRAHAPQFSAPPEMRWRNLNLHRDLLSQCNSAGASTALLHPESDAGSQATKTPTQPSPHTAVAALIIAPLTFVGAHGNEVLHLLPFAGMVMGVKELAAQLFLY